MYRPMYRPLLHPIEGRLSPRGIPSTPGTKIATDVSTLTTSRVFKPTGVSGAVSFVDSQDNPIGYQINETGGFSSAPSTYSTGNTYEMQLVSDPDNGDTATATLTIGTKDHVFTVVSPIAGGEPLTAGGEPLTAGGEPLTAG